MKQNGECRVSHCGECPDIEINYGKGYRCRKLNITKEFSEDLFSICPLPEIKEIKVWFEKDPKEAKYFDLCVYLDETPPQWIIKNKESTWYFVASFVGKSEAEAHLGCKIPEEVKP